MMDIYTSFTRYWWTYIQALPDVGMSTQLPRKHRDRKLFNEPQYLRVEIAMIKNTSTRRYRKKYTITQYLDALHNTVYYGGTVESCIPLYQLCKIVDFSVNL